MYLQNKLIATLLIALSMLLNACGEAGNGEPTDTPTSGQVNVIVDESFQQLFDTEIYTFHSLYQNAHVDARFMPESDALNRMMNDSCKVVVMCRDLSVEERKKFEQMNLFPVSTKIAEDAIALILHPENVDTALSLENIKSIFLGKDSTWEQINKQSKLGAINIVFDNMGSANTIYMRDSLLHGEPFSKKAFAVKSNPEVIEYVSSHKNAIGVLSVNWISDRDEPATMNYLKKIKVVGVSKGSGAKAFRPYQAYIKTKEYPFTRSVYMINRQTRAGLGKGFVSFVAGEKGQIMILKAGLVPAVSPVRLVEINTN